MRWLFALVFVFMLSTATAESYSIVYNQVGEKLVVKENNLSSFVSSEQLDKTSFGYYFVKRFYSEKDFETFSLTLNLEKGVSVRAGEIFPLNYQTKTDGQTISIVWNFSNVKKGETLAFFATLEKEKSNIGFYFLYSILIILLFVSVFFISRYFLSKKKNLEKYLLDDEKKVIKILKEAESKSLWQKNIQTATGFSKAKLSRMIRNLESRGLVEKTPIGNTNKVRLK